MDLLGKNGVLPQKITLETYKNLIKFILKSILSQFDVLSVQKYVHGQVQGFSTSTSKKVLVK